MNPNCFSLAILTRSLPQPVKAEWCKDEAANSIFFGPIISIFTVCFLTKILLHASAKMSHVYGSFSNDIMAVKELRWKLANQANVHYPLALQD